MKQTETIKRLTEQSTYNLQDLQDIVAILRGEGGCPWDREQTHESIRNDLIEETYEVVEAIDTQNATLLREELGDLLFQILFHAQIEAEEGRFVLNDVISDISAKMIHRHPHVFGTVVVENTGEVLSNWEMIKTKEKQRNTLTDKLRAIPPMLPALMRAQKVAKKSGAYDGTTAEDLIERMKAQIDEMQEKDDPSKKKQELGNLLLTAAAFAQKSGIPAEEALFEATNSLIDSL